MKDYIGQDGGIGLTVGELIVALKQYEKTMRIVIGNDVAQGLIVQHGRISDGYFGPIFRKVPEHKARDTVLTFGSLCELSDGTVEILPLGCSATGDM